MPKAPRFIELSVAPAGSGYRVDRFLKQAFPCLQAGVLQKAIRQGDVKVDGRKTLASHRLKEQARIALYRGLFQGAEPAQKPDVNVWNKKLADEVGRLILAEESDYVVLNKPSGIAVQGGTGERQNLAAAASIWAGQNLHIIHRLDKDTSGIFLLARNAVSARVLSELFKEHRVHKEYWALVCGVPFKKEGRHISWVYKKQKGAAENWVSTMTPHPEAKKAETYFRVYATNGHRSLVQFRPVTGRTHQIRLHARDMGAPVYGDRRYGVKADCPLLLHARILGFKLHGEQEVSYMAPFPNYFLRQVQKIGLALPPPEEGDKQNPDC